MRHALFFLSALLLGTPAVAQEDQEPSAIIETGAAVQSSLTGGGTGFGPNLAGETTPIEHWLEIEAGITPGLSQPPTA